MQLCSDNSLCLADELFLPRNTFTFISSSHDTVSWLDHILTTTSGYSLLTDICVKSDFITSDHLPLCFTISVDNLNVPISSSANKIPCDALRYNWYGASDFDISNYYSCTRSELSKIKSLLEAMQCEDVRCIKHYRDIDVFYSAITNCLHSCIKQCIPVLKLHNDTLLQVGMTMLAIITIYLALILNGEWLITDHVMGQFITQRECHVLNLNMLLDCAD